MMLIKGMDASTKKITGSRGLTTRWPSEQRLTPLQRRSGYPRGAPSGTNSCEKVTVGVPVQARQCAAVKESVLDFVAATTVHLQLSLAGIEVPGLAQHLTHRRTHGTDATIGWWLVCKPSLVLGRNLDATKQGIAPLSVNKWVDSRHWWSASVQPALLVQQPMQP